MMNRWIVLTVAVVAVLVASVWISGCTTRQVDTQTAAPVAEPDMVDHDVSAPVVDATPAEGMHDVDSAYTYTCPMHPDVQQDRPGNCPECGMFLVADTDEAVEYYCPMHPDVVQDEPGKCPECGMFLEARSAQNEDAN